MKNKKQVNNNKTINTKYKLKKKWRFWRVFKNFFLGRKQKVMFKRLSWNKNQIRIIWHHIKKLYGKTIKKTFHKKNNTNKRFDQSFYKSLINVESQLNIILVRLSITRNLIESNELIKKHDVKINNKLKNKNYNLCLQDSVKYYVQSNKIRKKPYLLIKYWRRRAWWKWRKIRRIMAKKRTRSIVKWNMKKNLCSNYFESSYKARISILIKRPNLYEIIARKKKLLNTKLIKKIFLLY